MSNFQFKDGDEQRAAGARMLDDIDMIISKHDGALVVVAMHNGQHVCQRCAEPFDESREKLRGVEMRTEGSRVLLHAKCLNPDPRSFRKLMDNIRGHQVRRFITKATKVFTGE